jgi:hypothetical protein
MVAAVFRLRDALECMYCGAARQATERGIHYLAAANSRVRQPACLACDRGCEAAELKHSPSPRCCAKGLRQQDAGCLYGRQI